MNLQAIIDIDHQLLGVFNGSDSLFLDGLMITLTSSPLWIPLYLALLYLIIKNNETMVQILIIIGFSALCFLLSSGMADGLMKSIVERIRPCNDPILKYQVDIVNNYRPNSFSFFSGHASNTLSIAIFIFCLVRSKLLGSVMFIWSFINSYTRLYLRVHYVSDVLAGWMWGAAVGFFTYFLCNRVLKRLTLPMNYISNQYTRTGYSTNDIDMVVSIFILTIIFAVIKALIISY